MQTAEELAAHIETQLFGLDGEERAAAIAYMSGLIEQDRAAVALAAKRDLLEELRACAQALPGEGDARYESLFSAIEMRLKATGGKDQSRCICGKPKSDHTPENGCVRLFSRELSK